MQPSICRSRLSSCFNQHTEIQRSLVCMFGSLARKCGSARDRRTTTKAQKRRAVANVRDLQKIRLCANSAVRARATKPRNVRRNSHSPKNKNIIYIRDLVRGGEGGIRTPDTVTRMPHFECGAFNHSATSPEGRRRESQHARLRPWAIYRAGSGETREYAVPNHPDPFQIRSS
jgi:hypothetical protein